MSAAVNKEIQLEIGHVLFIDIVSYSKLLITEQSEQLQTVNQIRLLCAMGSREARGVLDGSSQDSSSDLRRATPSRKVTQS
jgi:hypothetical protein